MNNKTGIAAIVLTLLGGLIATAASHSQTLTSLGRTDISTQFNPAFYEASGLGLSNGQNALWSISDGELKVYKLNLNGTSVESFVPTPVNTGSTVASVDFEGVTFAPPPAGISDDHFIYVANEAANAILPVNYSTQKYYAQAQLANMTGYGSVGCTGGGTVASEFSGSDPNSGLEGITWDGTYFYVIKEKDPALIVRVSANLTTILACKVLNLPNATDYSDISYDPTRGLFWIASDEAENVYLYNWSTNSMVKGWHLGIANMEGISFNPSNSRLSIATDNGDGSDSYLYGYSVQ
jgi:uncharacterized protein YjiK